MTQVALGNSLVAPEPTTSEVELTRKGFITNYPPFGHWRSEIAPQVAERRPLNIYLHSPYCIQRCSYCFYKTVTLRDSQSSEIDLYVDALCREIKTGVDRFNLKDRPVLSVYFGGGTPTLLQDKHMGQIFDTLSKYLNFGEPEFTVEAEPVSLTQRKADMLERFNVTRLNMGVQSFRDDIVRQTGRKDTESKMVRAIEIAKDTGALVNVDLISGLAGDTFDSWNYSLNRVLDLDVQSITVYKLEIYTNSQYFADLRKQNLVLPSDDEELEFMRHALDVLERAEYEPLNWYTFTKQGKYDHVHNRSIWGGDDLFSVGVSSFGRIGEFLYQNTNSPKFYTEMVDAEALPISRAYRLSSLDSMIRDIVLGIKLIRFDLNKFTARHGFRLHDLCGSVLDDLVARQFIELTEDEITLTKQGILYGDYVGKCIASALRALKA